MKNSRYYQTLICMVGISLLFSSSLYGNEMNNIDPETSLENHINNTENHVVEVSGIVLDAATKKPLAGVRVQPYNNRRFSALTNENGEFTIKVPDYTTSQIGRASCRERVLRLV